MTTPALSRFAARGLKVRSTGIRSMWDCHATAHGSMHHGLMTWAWRPSSSAPAGPTLAAVGVARVDNPEAEPFAVDGALVPIPDQPSGGLLAGTTNVTYIFIVPEYVTTFGEVLKVVGSCPELGGWDLQVAPAMDWQEGHKWQLEVRLPKEDFEFKVVALVEGEVRWEQGGNRVVKAEGSNLDVPVELVINLTCNFDHTWESNMELVLDRTDMQESYELASATLELLEKRRTRLVRTLQETTTQGPAVAEQQAEAARLSAAVNSQFQNVNGLQTLLTSARLSEDGQHLLVSMNEGKVEVPPVVGTLSTSQAAALSLVLGGDTQAAGALPEAVTATNRSISNSSLPLSSVVGDVVNSWGQEGGDGEAAPQVQGSSSGLSESDQEVGPEDAMAAAAHASLSSSKRRRRRVAKSARGPATTKPGASDAPAAATTTPMAAVAAAASNAMAAAAAAAAGEAPGNDVPAVASPAQQQPPAAVPVGEVDLSALPPPPMNHKGELFFSEALLASVKLPVKRINLTRRATPTLSRRTPAYARGTAQGSSRPGTPVASGGARRKA